MTRASARDLDDELRTVLHERAQEITGPAPDLPIGGARLEALSTRPVSTTTRHRVLAIAAAVIVLAAGAALASTRLGRPDRDALRTASAGADEAMLPPAFDLATAVPVFSPSSRGASPTAIAREYLGWRLSDLGADRAEVSDHLEVRRSSAIGRVTLVRWRWAGTSAWAGTVYVGPGPRTETAPGERAEGPSGVLAATTPGVDLRSVRVDGTAIVGHVRSLSAARTGALRVDVWERDHAAPSFPTSAPPAPDTFGYGSTARGDEPFRVDAGGSGAVVAVRSGTARRPAIAELYLAAPDADAPDLGAMTPEERVQYLRDHPDPRCTAAAAALSDHLRYAFPGGDGSAATVRSSSTIFDEHRDRSAAEAVRRFGRSVGVDLAPRTLAVTSPSSVISVGAQGASATVEVWAFERSPGRWDTGDATTPAACFHLGKGNLTPTGDPHPRARLDLPQVAGVTAGRLWFHEGGRTWTVALDADDFARGNVAVDADFWTIDRTAVVGRDDGGRPVLVQCGQY